MKSHDIIVIGASAGGVETLSNLVQQLPPELDAAVFSGFHRSSILQIAFSESVSISLMSLATNAYRKN